VVACEEHLARPAKETKMSYEIVTFVDQNTCIMRAAQIREELHKFINRADDRILNLIYGMMKADSEEELLTSEQQKDLDRRVSRHKEGESKSYSWAEARAQIEKGA
jgi:hypothetical protein